VQVGPYILGRTLGRGATGTSPSSELFISRLPRTVAEHPLHLINPFNYSISFGYAGKVKLAYHRENGERVAVKIVTKEFLFSSPNMRRKVEREIAIMKLLDNPHVLSLLDVYETTKYLYGCRSLASMAATTVVLPFLFIYCEFCIINYSFVVQLSGVRACGGRRAIRLPCETRQSAATGGHDLFSSNPAGR
jgi:serine/threonine protein kinase